MRKGTAADRPNYMRAIRLGAPGTCVADEADVCRDSATNLGNFTKRAGIEHGSDCNFEGALQIVGQLQAARSKQLDSVVGICVVARRHHDARHASMLGRERHAGCWQHAKRLDSRTAGTEAPHQVAHNSLTRLARIAPDHERRVRTKHSRCSEPYRRHEIWCERVGGRADSIGSESKHARLPIPLGLIRLG